jgi:hypothetical protein
MMHHISPNFVFLTIYTNIVSWLNLVKKYLANLPLLLLWNRFLQFGYLRVILLLFYLKLNKKALIMTTTFFTVFVPLASTGEYLTMVYYLLCQYQHLQKTNW